MEIAEKLAWLGLVLIHLLPAIAVFRPGGLAKLYGSKVGALLPLMEHRSLLFMAILVLCLWSAFDPVPRPAALVATSISVLGYFAVYIKHGMPEGALRTIAKVDLLALPLLAFIAIRMLVI